MDLRRRQLAHCAWNSAISTLLSRLVPALLTRYCTSCLFAREEDEGFDAMPNNVKSGERSLPGTHPLDRRCQAGRCDA
ncbi:hypothetical protein AAT19DRAFT_8586 [Rhodotorula toruloides]|uniref:Uncharacterized protein n=1 Tax=Rhodotorula toruloides TaxID=5286 RepID=A0A2T0AHM6_RHOTO|nr:hypothetical protein AAT19DRAFT_8586 [Rhodotorula toruloides]